MRCFEIGKQRPDQIFLIVAGYFTEIPNDPVNHLTAAGVEIGDHIAASGRVWALSHRLRYAPLRHRPLKAGGRFSLKARTPSSRSSVGTIRL